MPAGRARGRLAGLRGERRRSRRVGVYVSADSELQGCRSDGVGTGVTKAAAGGPAEVTKSSSSESRSSWAAAMAVARPSTAECLLKEGGRPLCCWALCDSSRAQATRSGGFSELLRGALLSVHHSESAADAWCCLPPASHRYCTVHFAGG